MNLSAQQIMALGIVAVGAYVLYRLASAAGAVAGAVGQAAEAVGTGTGYLFGLDTLNSSNSLGSTIYDFFNRDQPVGAVTSNIKRSPQGYGISIEVDSASVARIVAVWDVTKQQWVSVPPRKVPDGWQSWPNWTSADRATATRLPGQTAPTQAPKWPAYLEKI